MYIVGGFDGEKLNDIWRIDMSKLCYENWNYKTANKNKSLLHIDDKYSAKIQIESKNYFMRIGGA